ncbi:MAG: GTP-binding protein [Candidatus Colwellbacteria bacterium]|nr:GTP-binding protein [Candidatus Colwellbacteria bacterium]
MKQEKANNLPPRPPIVVVVGHVDHGKTSLLDYIRKTNVIAKEAGGITQSMGAYEIEHSPRGEAGNGKKITFIDTPGHEAFSKMRSRGAAVADLAVLVIAGDEGVKPQTAEAIKILNDTATPFVVAITKMDRPNANLDKIKNELLAAGVFLEGLGGNISWQGVSSKTGEGIEDLLNLILLMGEVLELTFDPQAEAKGFVIESLKDNRRGMVAHIILKGGVLKEGDNIYTTSAKGRVKVLENFLGTRVKSLEPSSPASILGFESLPIAGEEFSVGEAVNSEKELIQKGTNGVIEKDGENKPGAILKADTSGSLEVLKELSENIVNVKDSSLGDITDGDVNLAISSGGIILGFRVKVHKAAENLAKIHKIKIFTSDIIYKLLEETDAHLKGQRGPVVIGELEILKVFGDSGKRQIVGGKVLTGVIRVGSVIQVERNSSPLGEGKIVNVQEGKKDVREVGAGVECGMLIESEARIKPGDIIKVNESA